jgi:type IV secretion system protein VirB10
LLPPPDLPQLPETPDAGSGDVIPPPPPPISDNGGLFKGGKKDEDLENRIKSNMLLLDGGKSDSVLDAGKSASNSALVQSDPNRAFEANVIKGTGAEKETATRLNNLSMTIAQGKIINAVLETAIDTQLPGTLRAIVSRDTYAEAGRAILIPKGSRLIGTYNTGVLQGQDRVMIIWTRLIRPDGIDIAIGSPAVDGLGRAGIGGYVDNRYMQIFSGAILTTMLSLGAAVASDKLLPDANTTTTSSGGGSTTTNASPAQQAAGNAVNNLTDISKNVVGKIVDIRPTITIDQGTRISVFVNRDLTFPPELNDVFFVQ